MYVTDGELLRATGRGDREALRALYRRYSRAVYSWSARVLRSEKRAGPATVQVFLTVFEEARHWDRRMPVPGWLFALARRVVGDVAPDPDLYAVWLGGQAAAQLAELPLHQAEALRLVRYEERSLTEVAGILGLTPAEVGRALFEGLAALQESLEHLRARS